MVNLPEFVSQFWLRSLITSIYTRVSQTFCIILVMWGTIQQLQMHLSKLWKWRTPMHCEMPSYSPIAIRWIYISSLKHGFEIHDYMRTWVYLIVKVLATRVKCLPLFDYCSMINCTFTFRIFMVCSAALWLSSNSWNVRSQTKFLCTIFICIFF